jgi:RimJ/RimL family protein N-acetyltransferase
MVIKALNSLIKRNKSLQVIASSSRVYLREITKDDASFMYDLMNQKNWISFIGDKGIASIADAIKHIESGPMRSYKINGFGPYLVVDINSGESVGICGLLKRTYLDSPDLGYAISERFYRKGYGFEAAQLTLKIVDTLVDTKVIYATVKTENIGSCNLLHKLGFTLQPSSGLDSLGSEAEGLLLYKKENTK